MPTLNYSAMTKSELETLLKNATGLAERNSDKSKLRDALTVIEDVEKELSKRKKPKLKTDTSSSNSLGLIWEKTDAHTNRLFHNGEIVSEIILVANHSQSNRDVYNAYVFGKIVSPSFEYIGQARTAVAELVEKELVIGRGKPHDGDEPSKDVLPT